jgi:hypothetical protein
LPACGGSAAAGRAIAAVSAMANSIVFIPVLLGMALRHGTAGRDVDFVMVIIPLPDCAATRYINGRPRAVIPCSAPIARHSSNKPIGNPKKNAA